MKKKLAITLIVILMLLAMAVSAIVAAHYLSEPETLGPGDFELSTEYLV